MDNMERELFIRDADPEDAKKLVEIYSYYVLNTAVSDRVSVRCCTKSWKKGLKNRA